MDTFSTEQSLRLHNARLEALHQVAMGLTSTLELEQVLQRVIEMAQILADSAHAHIFLYDPARDEIRLATDIIAALQRELGTFVGTTPQFDDITAVMVKRL